MIKIEWATYIYDGSRQTNTQTLFGSLENLNIAGVSVVVVQMSFTNIINGTVFVSKKREKWLANPTCILAHDDDEEKEEEKTLKKMRKVDMFVSLLMMFTSEARQKKNTFKLRSVRYRNFIQYIKPFVMIYFLELLNMMIHFSVQAGNEPEKRRIIKSPKPRRHNE